MAQNETIQMSTNWWMDKQAIYKQNTTEYYSAIKINEIMIYAITCINLKNIMLS